MRFSEERYIESKRQKGQLVNDLSCRTRVHILPALGDLVVSELDAEQLRRWLSTGMPEGRKPVAGGSWSSRFTSDQWWLLPLPLRIRWWQETEYSIRVPSPELVEAVKAALAVKGAHR
jgi:hypothetical protein